MSIVVLAPDSIARELPALGDDVVVVHYHTADDAIEALSADADGFVIVSDGLDEADVAPLAHIIETKAVPCIEVRSERWDGSTPSPLSAACRGVISGFGPRAVAEAVRVLSTKL